ncbi:hypothetical protein CHU98_g4586 [Xylaria longipes]|nr:hypothetical protein CHU98_g4586 [Xylaria longipes]
MRVSGSSIVVFSQLLLPVLSADTAAWKSRNIYFALTDRVARSSDDTGGDACSDLGNYCGGTFKGLESKLDYISGMGFDAIWITPVVTNSDGGYHGYWAQDLYGINSNYGTADDLKSLVNAAHDKTSIEMCRISGLPDVNTESSEIQTLYQDWVKYLVSEYSFDGVRIDTVKHVNKEFWPGFSSAAGVYTIGEVFDGDVNYIAGYAGLMSGLLNYAIYYPMNNFYQQTGSSQALVDMHNQISSAFPDPAALGTFLDNHDNPRWLNAKNDVSLIKNALAYVILSRGVPIVYYGTEQAYAGGADPANREDLWRSGFNTNSDLYQAISKLSAARKSAGGLAADDQTHLYVADTAYAWSRAGGSLVVLTTNSGSGSSGDHCFDTQVPNGQWNNTFSTGSYTSDGDGNICVSVTNGEPVVLLAA